MKTINIHKETFLFAKKSKLKIDPKKDPIFGIIGLANEDPFASEIDDELYGDR